MQKRTVTRIWWNASDSLDFGLAQALGMEKEPHDLWPKVLEIEGLLLPREPRERQPRGNFRIKVWLPSRFDHGEKFFRLRSLSLEAGLMIWNKGRGTFELSGPIQFRSGENFTDTAFVFMHRALKNFGLASCMPDFAGRFDQVGRGDRWIDWGHYKWERLALAELARRK